MPAPFLHGVETIQVDSGARPITVVKAGVIGIIGTSAYAGSREPILITSPKDAAEKLGPAMAEFTLRKHVDLIFKQGSNATIIAVNVYDSEEHTAAVSEELKTITAGKFKLNLQPAPFYPVVMTNTAEDETYVEGDDFTRNIHGEFTILNPDLLATDLIQVKVSYTRHSASLVTEADVIGEYDGEDRSGLFVFDLARPMFNFAPKILVCPVFDSTQTMVDELVAKAVQLRARALINGNVNTVSEAITARGTLGEANMKGSSKRLGICWPSREVPFPYGVTEDIGLATFVAAAWSKQISEKDINYSPSNVPLIGAGNPNVQITGDINDPSGEANQLNEVGIITHMGVYGSDPRTWGNRSAAWPTETTVDNFLAVQLTADVIDESIEYAMLPYIDRPLTNALIESIKENVNAFLNSLVARGVTLPGSECVYDPAENSVEELALGHVTFNNSILPPTPAERITFKRYLATELLNSLGTNA
jgi:uncharacterized protein